MKLYLHTACVEVVARKKVSKTGKKASSYIHSSVLTVIHLHSILTDCVQVVARKAAKQERKKAVTYTLTQIKY